MNRSGENVQPFPYATLETFSRAEIATATRIRRVAKAYVDLPALAAALGEITKDRVDAIVRRWKRADGSKSTADAVGMVIEVENRRVLIEVEAALATTLAARVLQRPPPRLVDPEHPAPAALSGAVAALALAALRRSHAGSAFRVLEAGPAMAVARAHLAAFPRSTTAWLTVVIGPDAFEARVSFDDAHVPPPTTLDLASLGALPLALPIVAAACAASRSEIAALAPGDAFVVPGLALSPKTAALVPERGELGLRIDLDLEVAEAPRVVVRGQVEPFPWEKQMNADTTARVLDDASVVVRVEIGAVEMKAHEWAQLSSGDVVTLGKKLGEPVVLRAAGVEIARGELVQVEGEIGVRILSRTEDR